MTKVTIVFRKNVSRTYYEREWVTCWDPVAVCCSREAARAAALEWLSLTEEEAEVREEGSQLVIKKLVGEQVVKKDDEDEDVDVDDTFRLAEFTLRDLAAIQAQATERRRLDAERKNQRDRLGWVDELAGPLEAVRAKFMGFYNEGLLERLFPGFSKLDGCTQHPSQHAEGDALVHTALVVAHAAQDNTLSGRDRLLLLLAAIVHDIEKPATREEHPDGKITFYRHAERAAERCKEFGKTLGLSDEDTEVLTWLVRHHMDAHVMLSWGDAKRLELYQHPAWKILVALQEADAKASWHNADGSEHAPVLREQFAADAEKLRAAAQQKAEEEAFAKRVTEALKARGHQPGPLFGAAKKAAKEAAKEALPANASDAELSAWLDGWLAAQGGEQPPA